MANIDLSLLKDIHLPNYDISFFPLAFGWWLIILVPLLIIALLFLLQNLKKTGARFLARRELNAILNNFNLSNHIKLVKISELLKRVAIKKFGYHNISSLYGNKWADFIIVHSKNNNQTNKQLIAILASAVYAQNQIVDNSSLENVKNIALNFIKAVL